MCERREVCSACPVDAERAVGAGTAQPSCRDLVTPTQFGVTHFWRTEMGSLTNTQMLININTMKYWT